jgi:hypothetical protein
LAEEWGAGEFGRPRRASGSLSLSVVVRVRDFRWRTQREILCRGPKSGYSCQHLVQRKGSPSTLQPEHTHEVWWREASRITIRPSEELLRLPGLLVVFTLYVLCASCDVFTFLALMSPASASDFAVGLFGRAWRSMVCVIGGWSVMIACLLLQYARYASVNPRWYGMPAVFGTYSLPYAGGVWLVFVLPLYCFVPHRSRLWSWQVAVPLFGLTGFLVMSFLSPSDSPRFTNRVAGLAAVLGAASGLFSAVWQRCLSRRAGAA